MFTGIITNIGTVESVQAGAQGKRLSISCDYPPQSIALGASIACNGVCLTVVEVGETQEGSYFEAELSPETLAKTTGGSWTVGTHLNLERALKLGDELGGHMVAGHVDGVGEITSITPRGDYYQVVISSPQSLMPFLAPKGSVTVDGVSLTVNSVTQTSCSLMIIPHTWNHTVFHYYREGTQVNLEVDLIARYVKRMLETR